MKKLTFITLLIALLGVQSCGIYSFTGTNISPDVKTIQIDYFLNNALLVEPSLSQSFTTKFRDLFDTQTNLTSVKSGGDLQFEGEITGYKINPMTDCTTNSSSKQVNYHCKCSFF